MKKILCLLMLSTLFLLVGCNRIKEYKGKDINTLTFTKIDYNGGHRMTYTFDFIANTIDVDGGIPGMQETYTHTDYPSFTEEQEEVLINKCYTYGLFSLKDRYDTIFQIIDGGGWDLTLTYDDGTKKTSTGNNASPRRIFNKCAYAFFDLCQDGVVGSVDSKYYCPPGISVSFEYKKDNYYYSTTYTGIMRGDYLWNNFSSTGNNLFEMNDKSNDYKYLPGVDYSLVIYTANYGNNERFVKSEIFCYDNNQELSNKKVVYTGRWIKQKEFSLELDKIYVIRLTFRDGDYVDYTFKTKLEDSKILYGDYQFHIYNEGNSYLTLNEDMSFIFKDYSLDKQIDGINGTYRFDENKNYLYLDMKNNQKITFEYYGDSLYLIKEMTDYPVAEEIINASNTIVYHFDQ